MFCNNCGKKIADNSKFCSECGAKLTDTEQYDNYQPINQTEFNSSLVDNPDDGSSFGYALLSFFVPIIGLVLFIVWNKEYPKRAKSCLHGIIVGVVLWAVFFCCMTSSMFNYSQTQNDFDIYYDMFVR